MGNTNCSRLHGDSSQDSGIQFATDELGRAANAGVFNYVSTTEVVLEDDANSEEDTDLLFQHEATEDGDSSNKVPELFSADDKIKSCDHIEVGNEHILNSKEEILPLKVSHQQSNRKEFHGVGQGMVGILRSLARWTFRERIAQRNGKAMSDYGSMSSGKITKAIKRKNMQSTRQSLHQTMKDKLHPMVLLKRELYFLQKTFVYVILPALTAAIVLFYHVGNPKPSFLSVNASMSWWLLFFVRQCVTLHLAWNAEYIFVQVLALRSTLYRTIIGPLIPLFVIQGIGWPFVSACWGLLDLLLIADWHPFPKNWFCFLNAGVFTDANPDGGVLRSNFYFRLLASLIIVGVATSIKRTYVALYIGKRTFLRYNQQLERIVGDIRLLTAVADLGAETDSPEFSKFCSLAEQFFPRKQQRSTMFDIQFEDRRQSRNDISSSSASSSSSISDQSSTDESSTDQRGRNRADNESFSAGAMNDPQTFIAKSSDVDNDRKECVSFVSKDIETSQNKHKIKNMLDMWEEPVNKALKVARPSIPNILKFRAALLYIEDTYPFSLSFGRADTRDQCLRSSRRLYRRLLKYTPGRTTLEFNVVGALAYERDGRLNEEKRKNLGRMFRTDNLDDLSLVSFVQSCDRVYKDLRYFLESVGNSVTIDRVLEQVVNAIFVLMLFLLILYILRFDPWKLVVSLSTIMVSFAFAFGPSTAKYIDGILLIAVRRPFDLGDRISFSPPEGGGAGMCETWLVEDISLSSTTLRFAATNEVTTINNASIANSRIFNGNHSPRSIINITVLFQVDATHKQVQLFRTGLEMYIQENDKTWKSLVHFRTERIDNAVGFVEYSLRVQHRKSWQEQTAVLIDKGELTNFCHQLSNRIGISFRKRPTDIDIIMVEPSGSGHGVATQRDSENNLHSCENLTGRQSAL